MNEISLTVSLKNSTLLLEYRGYVNIHTLSTIQKQTDTLKTSNLTCINLSLNGISHIDTSGALYINKLLQQYPNVNIVSSTTDIDETLSLVQKYSVEVKKKQLKSKNIIAKLGISLYSNYKGFLSFFEFLGILFISKVHYLLITRNIRLKEIAFQIYETGIKAFPIILLTSCLIGLVIAYQSAFQLKLYGANIYIVDMLGISIFRELAPLITAIVIAGRSGSAFTAQIGAMKITEELDAMRTMGFDPYVFLVMPRVLALMIVMPLLIFVADIMGVLGGMLVANIDLGISPSLFLDRFVEVVGVEHFFIGIIKGPLFAFLIATIGIYRGLMVKNDTQSIGFNTTKSVVEAILAVIVCDALFSIALTNLGI